MTLAGEVVLFRLLCALIIATASDDITAKPGEDVLLHCQAPRDAVIEGIVWSRTDLESDQYVFFLRENSLNGFYQLPSYRGRVSLSDPEMKDGNVSVVLKNVSVSDTGTYQCRVIIKGGDGPKHYGTTQLKVEGHTAGDEGDKDGGDKDGGDKDGGDINRHYGLIAVLLLVAVVVVVVVMIVLFVQLRKRPKNNNSADEEAGPKQDTLLDQRTVNFTDRLVNETQISLTARAMT